MRIIRIFLKKSDLVDVVLLIYFHKAVNQDICVLVLFKEVVTVIQITDTVCCGLESDANQHWHEFRLCVKYLKLEIWKTTLVWIECYADCLETQGNLDLLFLSLLPPQT